MGGGFTANSERSRRWGVGVRFGLGGVLEREVEASLLPDRAWG